MRVVFCDNGFNSREVDFMYADEFQEATSNGITCSLISFEELKRGNIGAALKNLIRAEEEEITIYRGWMLKPAQYELLFKALLAKNIRLINSPEEYQFCHHLPESYEAIKAWTPKTIFKKLKDDFEVKDFQESLKEFGNAPIIVKDFVKSQKHYWSEACFIPDASDLKNVEKITKRFLELQGDDLNEGIVYREFVELEKLTNHSKSGMPLTMEFRLFVKNKKVIGCFPYWDEGDYKNVQPDLEQFQEVISKINSNFFTMDIAKKKEGDWIIVELGDGQVAGLPDNADNKTFYQILKKLEFT